MSVLAAAYRKMVAAGMSTEDIAEMLEIMEEGFARPMAIAPTVDEQAERRRAKDRERARVRRNPQTSADSADETPPSSSLSPSSPDPSNHIPNSIPEPTPFTPLKGGVSPALSLPTSLAEPSSAKSDDVQAAFEIWNETARKLNLPKAKTLDKTRRQAIRARLCEGGLEGWREAVRAVERSPFCRGENDRNWKADLDFVCQAKSYRKLREGSYGGDEPEAQIVWTDDRWRAALEFHKDTGRWGDAIGPPPTSPACEVPRHVLAEFGFAP